MLPSQEQYRKSPYIQSYSIQIDFYSASYCFFKTILQITLGVCIYIHLRFNISIILVTTIF